MSEIDLLPILLPLESKRRSVTLPPGVADVMALCADEQTRRDYTGDLRAAREALARMVIRHSMHQQHRAMLRARCR